LKTLSLLAGLLVGAALIYGALDMPKWADPNSPAATHVSPYYLQHSIEHTATPNVVTSVLADNRGYDTLGETTVVFTSGMAFLLLLKKGRKR
jgi:multicomponent Na+:H+ antiporter subunit B